MGLYGGLWSHFEEMQRTFLGGAGGYLGYGMTLGALEGTLM